MDSPGERVRTFQSEAEIEAVVRGFEGCALKPSEFGHREHLAVAVWYLARADFNGSLVRAREGIKRFLRRHGEPPEVYHETITRFWLSRVSRLLEKRDAGSPLVEVANSVLGECRDPSLIYDYYSRERLGSGAARAGWVEPDLRPLDF